MHFYTMLMVSTVSVAGAISTQPASNFFLLTDHTTPGLSALLPTSATHTVDYHLLKYLQGIAHQHAQYP